MSPTCATSPSRSACRSSPPSTTTTPAKSYGGHRQPRHRTNLSATAQTSQSHQLQPVHHRPHRLHLASRCATSSTQGCHPRVGARSRCRAPPSPPSTTTPATSFSRLPSAPASPGRTSSTASSPPSSRLPSRCHRLTAPSRPAQRQRLSTSADPASPAPAATSSTMQPAVMPTVSSIPMKGLRVNREGHNVLGYRAPGSRTSPASAEKSPRPPTASTAAASPTSAASTFAPARPIRLHPQSR